MGSTASVSYFPQDNSAFFNGCKLSILDWIRQYSKDETETYLRGFLGRMLFSGDDIFKNVDVLSGGEKVRCMFSRMMLFQSNVLILDRPTNHLDLESITAVNNGLSDFKGNVLFASHDYEIVQTVANRIIEIADKAATTDREHMRNMLTGERQTTAEVSHSDKTGYITRRTVLFGQSAILFNPCCTTSCRNNRHCLS